MGIKEQSARCGAAVFSVKESAIEIIDLFSSALGIDQSAQELSAMQMSARAFVIYFFTLLTIKAGKKRFMGKNSALDVVMVIILGSVISRAVNGSAPFFPTLAASMALTLTHRLMAWAVARFEWIGNVAEGRHAMLVSDGHINWDEMRRHDITEKDLYSALRLTLNTGDMAQVKDIYLEPNGRFSVVKKPSAN